MEAANGDGEEEAVVACECECCGFTEECTARYISVVRARYGDRWICGLCGDAVGEELGRAPISPAEALDRHVAVCGTRRASAPPSPEDNAGDLIAAVRLLLLRRLGSSPPSTPRRVRSTPSSPRRGGASTADGDVAGDSGSTSAGSGIALVRTGSCFAALVE
jgi:hypothetical protein